MKFYPFGYAAVLLGCAIGLSWYNEELEKPKSPQPMTFYLPDAVQGSQPFCLSNRSQGDIQVANGPLLHPGQTITASEVQDFQWEFTQLVPSTERGDVDCFVVGK